MKGTILKCLERIASRVWLYICDHRTSDSTLPLDQCYAVAYCFGPGYWDNSSGPNIPAQASIPRNGKFAAMP